MRKKICVLTGAGISAESGLKTFRDADGLWEGHDVMAVASIDGWYKDPESVLRFYNERRAQLSQVSPNQAHFDLSILESEHYVVIITQNVDDLHERAGSNRIIHLHGELTKMRGWGVHGPLLPYDRPIQLGDTDEQGNQLRPHIVWFGEEVPMLHTAAEEIANADIVLVIGTSMLVYPAAGLVSYAPSSCAMVYIDLNPSPNFELQRFKQLKIFAGPATVKTKEAIEFLQKASLI